MPGPTRKMPTKKRRTIAQPERPVKLGELNANIAAMLDELVKTMFETKRAGKEFIAENSAAFTRLEQSCIELMHEHGLKKYEGPDHTATLVEPEVTVVDWDGLQQALTASQWDLITARTPDKAKLEAAVKLRKIDGRTVKKFVSTKPTKVFVITKEV